MKERPILFNAAMVRAILSGAKTQTRRPCVPPKWADVQDREWPQLARALNESRTAAVMIVGPADGLRAWACPYGKPGDRLWVRETWCGGQSGTAFQYRADWTDHDLCPRWRPSIHMPRWASRIDLEVTRVRVERLSDVTEADARAEGFDSRLRFIEAFREIYDGVNPWVWVVDFKRVTE